MAPSGGRAVLVALAVGAGVLAVPSAAGAGDSDDGTIGPINYRSSSGTVTPSSGGSTPGPECLSPARPVGGGVSISGDFSESYLSGSMPGTRSVFGIRRWGASWLALSGSSKALSMSAACMDVEVRIRVADRTLPGDSARTTRAWCPSGTHVSGGGGFGGSYLNSSHPVDDGDRGSAPDDGWRLRVYNARDEATFMRAMVLCVDLRPRYEVAGPVPIGSGTTAGSQVLCGADDNIIGGGLRLGRDASEGRVMGMTFGDGAADVDAIPDDRLISVAGNAGSPAKPMRMFAICRD